jgi:crotonobetainyl-CoA:carnitine CoA-transferase CaiB-like acyl-CoA transferase
MNFSSYILASQIHSRRAVNVPFCGEQRKGERAMRPFEGIRVIDVTHVLAGPFAAYQLALLGADVIKVDDPNDPDQSRSSGMDAELNRRQMGTGFLTQGSNKRAITLDLKTERGRDILKKLAATADVFVENYRPGAFDALGLGYEDLAKINPRLIYASFSAFGQNGPRREQTAYDHVIQATSGIMAMTGTKEVNPVKFGSPAIDYATGMSGAFALSAALFQREKTGKGQRVDMAMLDVAMILMSSHLTAHLRTGWHPTPHGNRHSHATNGAFAAKDGALIMLGASNVRQQKRLWDALGRPDMAKSGNDAREADHAREIAVLDEIMLTRTAGEWEEYLQARHVPACRVRTMGEALADPQIVSRGILHRHAGATGVDGPFTVPVAPFMFAHGGPQVDTPPPALGEHNDEIFAELGFGPAKTAAE